MAQHVNLERYPVDQLDSEEGQGLLAKLRHQLEEQGHCALPGFLKDESVCRKSVEEVLHVQASGVAYHSDNAHNVYLEQEDPTLDEDHPRNRSQRSAKTCVTYDQISDANPVAQVFHWDALTDFLAAVLGKEKLYRTADPLGALNIHIYNQGDNLGWHFDRGEFAVTLLLQSPEEGGHFEYVPNLRTPLDPHYKQVDHILRTAANEDDEGGSEEEQENRKRRLPMEPGTLLLFCGRNSLHRVTEVQGSVPRVLAVLSYETKPGVMLNEYTRLKFFGRTV
ncbi:ArpA protein [Balamuthia mandrillaris]